MAESGNMTFSHTYKTKLDQAGPAAFDTVHKSYIADKESGINDNIYGNFNRDQVMQGVRANLKAKMTHANEASRAEAEQMKEKQGVTEQLKAENQMLWVGKMNNIIACAEEIVVREVVYV